MLASVPFDIYTSDTRSRRTSPYLNVPMTKRFKASVRVAGEYYQISQCSEKLTAVLARHEDAAERAALAAAEDAAADAEPARDWLRPKEVAQLIGVSVSTVRRMATRRYDPLPAYRPSGAQDGWFKVPLAAFLTYYAGQGWQPDALAVLEARARALLAPGEVSA